MCWQSSAFRRKPPAGRNAPARPVYSPTLIVTAATRRVFKKPFQPTHVVLEDAEGLAPSLFMLEVIRTIDKRRVKGYVGKLTEGQMERIDAALRVSLRLDEDAFLPTEMEEP